MHARRVELLRAWVGDAVLRYVHGHRFGLLDLEAVPQSLDGPHLHFAGALTFRQTDIGRELTQVFAAPRPWLSRATFKSVYGRKRVSARSI